MVFKTSPDFLPGGEKFGLTRSSLIHSYSYASVSDCPTCYASLPLKSKSFMHYAGQAY